jgi:hypothetical protein
MATPPSAVRYAERVVEGLDDGGATERIVIWIERRGPLWAVGRAVNPQHRPTLATRPDDYLFEGYELDDALECANGALRDDVHVSLQDGRGKLVRQFDRAECLTRLERSFFDRR